MKISPMLRLWLYIGASVTPIWLDFFKLSTDYSLRGLAMPIFASVNAAIIVTLARTASREPEIPPVEPEPTTKP